MVRWAFTPFIASALLTTICAFIVARRRTQPGASEYAMLLVIETTWTLAIIGELAAPTFDQKIGWDNVQLVSLCCIAIGVLRFVWAYSERRPPNVRVWKAALLVIPLATCLYVFTDAWHGQARATAYVVPGHPFDSLIYDFTPLEWMLYLQTLTIVAYSLLALGRTAARQHREHRFQTSLVALAIALPTIASLLGIAGLRFLGQRDLAPACFGIAAAPVTWALYRRRFFDLVPFARHLVFEELPDPVVVLDSRDRIVDVNPTAQGAFGLDRKLVGTSIASLFPAMGDVGSLVRDGTSHTLRIAGRTFDVRADEFAAGRESRGRVLLFRDVTERVEADEVLKSAHEALEERVEQRTAQLHEANDELVRRLAEIDRAQAAARASEWRFRTLFDQSFQLMAVVAPDGTLIAANRTSLELAGIEESDVVGKPFVDGPWWRHSIELQEKVRAGLARAVMCETLQMEVTHPDKLGEIRHFDFSLKALGSLEDAPCMVLAESRDITEHQHAEEERSLLREQLHHSQKLDSIGRLAGGIAHDFNNLLTVIVGQAELARIHAASDESADENLAQIEQASESAASLTRQLLAFARKQPSEPSVLDPNGIIEETHRMLARVIGEDVRLRLELEAKGAHVRIDKGQLEQVLLNLAVNARDAMPGGGLLTIATDDALLDPVFVRSHGVEPSPNGFVRIRVRDTGVGMTREVRERIFEPFFTTKAVGSGTGLGLATVYGAVTQAGGFVSVASALYEGSTFDVYLPNVEEEPTAPRERSSVIPVGSERIALVEDQAAVRELATEQLVRLGYEVVAYASAEEALARLPRDIASVDLLVTDVVLGGMNGPTLAAELRKTRGSLRVLYVSGYTDDAVLSRGVDARDVALVHKPFTLEELARAVRETIDGSA